MFALTGKYFDRADQVVENQRKTRKENLKQFRDYMTQAAQDGREVTIQEMESFKNELAGGDFFDAQRLPSSEVIKSMAEAQANNAFETRTKQIANVADQQEQLRTSVITTYGDAIVNMDTSSDEQINKFKDTMLKAYGGDEQAFGQAWNLVGNDLTGLRNKALDQKVKTLLPELDGLTDEKEVDTFFASQPKSVRDRLKQVKKGRMALKLKEEETKALASVTTIPADALLRFEDNEAAAREFVITHMTNNSALTREQATAVIDRAMPMVEAIGTAQDRANDRSDYTTALEAVRASIPEGSRISDLSDAEIEVLIDQALRNTRLTTEERALAKDRLINEIKAEQQIDTRTVIKGRENAFTDKVYEDEALISALKEPDVPDRDQVVFNRINELRRRERLKEFESMDDPEYQKILEGIDSEARIELASEWNTKTAEINSGVSTLLQSQREHQTNVIGAQIGGLKDNDPLKSVLKTLDIGYHLGAQVNTVVQAASEKLKGKSDSVELRQQVVAELVAEHGLVPHSMAETALKKKKIRESGIGPKPGTSAEEFVGDVLSDTNVQISQVIALIEKLPADTPAEDRMAILQPILEKMGVFEQSLMHEVDIYGNRFNNLDINTVAGIVRQKTKEMLERLATAQPKGDAKNAVRLKAQVINQQTGQPEEREFYRINPDEAERRGIEPGIYSITDTGGVGQLLQSTFTTNDGKMHIAQLKDNDGQRIREEVNKLLRGEIEVTSDGIPRYVEDPDFFSTDTFAEAEMLQMVFIARKYAALLNMDPYVLGQQLFGRSLPNLQNNVFGAR